MAELSYKADFKPSFRFYVDDWLSEPALRGCSLAARGLWADMLCIMWKAKRRGCLEANAKQMSSRTLAQIAGCTKHTASKLVAELEQNQVLSRLPDKTIICRRMYRNHLNEKALAYQEKLMHEKKAKAGRLGGQASRKARIKKERSKNAQPPKQNDPLSFSFSFPVPKEREEPPFIPPTAIKEIMDCYYSARGKSVGAEKLRAWIEDDMKGGLSAEQIHETILNDQEATYYHELMKPLRKAIAKKREQEQRRAEKERRRKRWINK